MVTQNPRLNVVLEPRVYSGIAQLARKAGVSLSLMARDLLKEALELQEDLHWQDVAEKREKALRGKSALPHKDVWK